MYPNQMYPKLVEKWLKKWLKIGWRWATPPKVRRNKEFLVFLILFLLNMVVIIPNMGICYYKIGYLSSYKTKNQWLGYNWGTKRGTKGVHRSHEQSRKSGVYSASVSSVGNRIYNSEILIHCRGLMSRHCLKFSRP